MAKTNYTKQQSGFRTAEKHYGGHIYGMFPGCGGLIRVTEVVTTTTVFKAELLQELGEAYGDVTLIDMFNVGWSIKGIQCAQAGNEGVVVDVTDFDQTNGKVTTAAMTATYTVGDILWLAPDELVGTAGIGTMFTFTKDYTNGQVTTGGVALATATGTVFVRSISVQGTAITSSATNLILTSDDAAPGACARWLFDAITAGNFLLVLNGVAGCPVSNRAIPIGHTLATTKVLTLKAVTAALAATPGAAYGLRVVLECVRMTANASLA